MKLKINDRVTVYGMCAHLEWHDGDKGLVMRVDEKQRDVCVKLDKYQNDIDVFHIKQVRKLKKVPSKKKK